ncbi:unnamed protein product [Durusdinium trenchii]|uniref:AMMECR1 domain-containing protein n=1 Tax=Durusdinium trenchii TaxID=1381693 RepID=A0ABP0REE8_9DINO
MTQANCSPQATEELCYFCFKVLLAKLQGKPLPSQSALRVCWDAQPVQVPGLFVGWHTGPSGLRGCMGTLKPVELHRGLSDYALQSALHDLRFSPISLKEVKMLTCRVSILHSFESCSDPLDWKLGTHGVTIAFTAALCSFCPCGTCRYTATLLPEVISEEGMSQEAVLEKLVHKAGYRRHCSPKMMRSLEVTRFQTGRSSRRSSWDLGVGACRTVRKPSAERLRQTAQAIGAA